MERTENCAQCGRPLHKSQRRCLYCGMLSVSATDAYLTEKRAHEFDTTCSNCGAFIPKNREACLICKTQRAAQGYREGQLLSQQPHQNINEISKLTMAPSRQGRAITLWQRLGRSLSALIACAIVCIAGIGIYHSYFDTSSYRASEAILYVSPDNHFMLSYPGIGHPVEVTGIPLEDDAFPGSIQASANGRWLVYTTHSGDIYLLDMAQRPQDVENFQAVFLAQSLPGTAEISNTANLLIYLTHNKEMMAYDFIDGWQVDTGVESIIAVEGQNAIYTLQGERSASHISDLYLAKLQKIGGERLLVDRSVAQVLDWTEGFDRILYTQAHMMEGDTWTSSLNAFELRQRTAAMLVEEVGVIVDASAEMLSAIYLMPVARDWRFETFFDDDLLATDALTDQPDLQEYPKLAWAFDLYGEGAELTDLEEDEALLEQNLAYTQALNRWEEKQKRDHIRSYLKAKFHTRSKLFMLYDLYLYRAGSITLLNTEVITPPENLSPERLTANAEKGYVLYQTNDPKSLSRLRMSELWEDPELIKFDFDRYYIANTTHQLVYSHLEDDPICVFTSSSGLVAKLWAVTPKLNGIYFSAGDFGDTKRPDSLFYMPLTNGKATDAAKVDSGTEHFIDEFKGGILYHCVQNGDFILSFAQNGSVRQFGQRNSVFGSLENQGGTLLYYDDFNFETSSGNLYMLSKDEIQLAAHAEGYDYRNDQLVYLQKRSAEPGGSTLYVWRSGRETLLCENVLAVITMK